MKYLVVVEGSFDSKEEAEAAMSEMEDAIGKNNGEIVDAVLNETED